MKDYSKEIKELQTIGSKLSDEGNKEIGNLLYLAAVDMEDLWTQYQALSAELKRLREDGEEMTEIDGEQMSSEDEKDNRCGNCVHWKRYEVCNHYKERHCENKNSPYYLKDTQADTRCFEFLRE